MPVAPPVLLDAAPSLNPPRFGLLSAGELVDWNDPHLHNGIEYVPNATGEAGIASTDCDDHTAAVLDDGLATVVSGPIPVVAGITLPSFALDPADAAARARARLAAGEVAAVEKRMWASAAHPLTANPTVLSHSALALADAVGLLEEWFDARYGGTPVIHAPRRLGVRARDAHAAERDGAKLITPLGSVWSFGNYPGTAPASETGGSVPPLWLVASGQVQIRRSDVVVDGVDLRSSLNRRTNRTRVSARRTYVVSWDGITAAVPVTT
ncbi:MAG: hypothetical protein QM658_03130 [Gordonia sp. (in: high G+C Gram-positive bacteria)]